MLLSGRTLALGLIPNKVLGGKHQIVENGTEKYLLIICLVILQPRLREAIYLTIPSKAQSRLPLIACSFMDFCRVLNTASTCIHILECPWKVRMFRPSKPL